MYSSSNYFDRSINNAEAVTYEDIIRILRQPTNNTQQSLCRNINGLSTKLKILHIFVETEGSVQRSQENGTGLQYSRAVESG